ncbi:MAG: hypothetical protein ACREJ3_03205 [Polyangiaceae bacterium]
MGDDPSRAMPFFFPLRAYEQVKDVANPRADWAGRLVAAYTRDIHALPERLGGAGEQARLVKLDVALRDGATPRWVKPGEEWNKVGYYRVYGSKLRYTDKDGQARAFDIKSLISWRGEWFIVHLCAFK